MTSDTQWRNNFIFASVGSCLELDARCGPVGACDESAGPGRGPALCFVRAEHEIMGRTETRTRHNLCKNFSKL